MMKSFEKIMLSLFMIVLITLQIPCNISAANYTISGNDTWNTAYPIGVWNTTNSWMQEFFVGQNESYYKFTANTGEKIGIKFSAGSETSADPNGFQLALYDSSNRVISTTSQLLKSTSTSRFKYIRFDVPISGTYYISVKRTKNIETYAASTLSFESRIKTGSGTFSMTPSSITNQGNISLNLNGVESEIASVDLRNNIGIPDGAVVTSVTTTSTQFPIQGNIFHQVKISTQTPWTISSTSSATSGFYNISASKDISAKSIWQFKYNAKATAKSTMTNIKITLNYNYDSSLAYIYA